MGLLLTKILASLALPPAVNLLTALAGYLLSYRWYRFGMTLVVIALVSLYVLSIEPVARTLVSNLETFPVLQESDMVRHQPQAIVVLGGGTYTDAPEYGGDTVAGGTLERLRYGARLHRQTGLPLLVTGGRVYGETHAEATLMKSVLTDEFGVAVKWAEDQSRNTFENARNSKVILNAAGISKILLVTHAFHMPRAIASFVGVGIEVVPAPMGFVTWSRVPAVMRWLPGSGLSWTRVALHEYLGRLWYRIRY